MGNPEAIHCCQPDPTYVGSRLPKLGNAGSTLTLLVAILFLFCNVNIALGASFVLQDGKRIEGEIVYASASSVIIRKTNGATAQLGRHTIDRVRLATGKDAVLEGELESWEMGVYEISNQSSVYKVRDRRIISQRQISSQDTVVATAEKKEQDTAAATAEIKQQDSVVATAEAKEQDTAAATAEIKQQDSVVATAEANEQDTAAATAEIKQQDSVVATAEAKDPETVAATIEEKDQDIIVAAVEGKEDAKNLVFKLGLSKPAKQKVLLIFSTEDGSALAGSDYEAKRGSMVLQPGTTDTTVSVKLLDDDLAEGDETFELLVTTDLDLATVKVRRGSATILDDEKQ